MKARCSEKTFPDVGGGFVEPHPRGDGIDWSEEYPHKGSETTQCQGLERGLVGGISGARRVEIRITPPDDARRHTCAVHGLWLCNLCSRADGGIGP
jgi:hypothetical protein